MGSLNPENTSKQDLDDSGCVQDASVTENNYKGLVQLLDLSDDVLLYILKYCSPMDLKALGYTCSRLGALICDRTLWTRVDARPVPIGQLRLHWFLKHCLSAATTELLLTGYANRHSRCLGIQDLHSPLEAESGAVRGTYVEHFLLRMWYPHLPRFAVTPRWPDKEEAESKAPQKASEATTSNSGESSASNSGNSSNLGNRSNSSNPSSSSNSSNSSNPSNSSNASNSSNSSNSGPKKDAQGFPKVFDDDRGNCKGPQFTLTAALLRDLRRKCPHLTSLALEYFNIDCKMTTIRQLPRNLTKLSLRGTRCYNLPLNTSFLGKVQDHLPLLEYLDVSECEWFEPASLMPLSKLPALEQLYMRDCKRLTECVAYASLATRYGFRHLKIIDVRGSPLADSEISALGWLPLLEELYCAPPDDKQSTPEHTHSWSDTTAPHHELDSWEIEAPDYYRVKTPEPDATDEDDEQNYEPEPLDPPPERPGDILMGNPWWSHERRIIVIQPNRQAEENRQAADVAPERVPIPAQIAPVIQQVPVAQRVGQAAQRAVAQAAPRPLPLPLPQQGLGAQGPAPFVLGDVHIVPIPRPVPPAEPAAAWHPHRVDPELSRSIDAMLDEYGAIAEQRGIIQPDPANQQPGPANQQPGPANQQPGPANPQPGPANPQAGAEEAGPSKRRANPEDPLDLAKRRRLDDDDDDDDEEIPEQRVQCVMSAEQCPRLRDRGMVTDPPIIPVLGNRPRVQIRHNNPFMHVDLETQRQSTIHIGNHIGYHLISDSAILRFGRAENDNINYVHIGRNGIHDGVEPGMRPDRSNLRVLSVTGYRSVTDRSLQHLATAAPNLVSVDFTDTSVSSEGVAVFKAHRPNCEVIFNEWGRIYK